MKQIILLLVLLLVGSMFLVSCIEEVTDQEIKDNLKGLSDEELDTIITENEPFETKAIIGEAQYSKNMLINGKSVSISKVRAVAQILKQERVSESNPQPFPGPETISESNPQPFP